MRNSKLISINQNQLLKKALDKLISDILRDASMMPEVNSRLQELATTYGMKAEYLQGYIWGQLVALAQHATPPSFRS